jgi:hypothetical protein
MRTGCGIVRPSALAVLMVLTRSTLVACALDMSAGPENNTALWGPAFLRGLRADGKTLSLMLTGHRGSTSPSSSDSRKQIVPRPRRPGQDKSSPLFRYWGKGQADSSEAVEVVLERFARHLKGKPPLGSADWGINRLPVTDRVFCSVGSPIPWQPREEPPFRPRIPSGPCALRP